MIAIIWKGTIVLAAAFLAAALLRRRSAALRHFVWTAAFAALLLLPLVAQVHDLRVTVPMLTAVPPDAVTDVVIRAGHGPAPQRQVPWLPLAYSLGVLFTAGWFVFGVARTARLVRGSRPAAELGADVLLAPEAEVPMAWGILRRAVVLPQTAPEWPAARLASVLLHERMHHRRHDLLAQAIGQAACCVFWFHPLAWMALAKQRAERERACDDAVLREGVAAHEYAGHLMEIVQALGGRRRRWASAPAMAEGGGLEARIRELLDARRDRRPLTRRAAAGIASAAIAILLPLAALEVHAQTAAGGTITGTVRDPSGAVVPGCRVTVTNPDGSTGATVVTNAVGQYRLAGVPSGPFTLEFSQPGFRRGKTSGVLVSGAVATADFNLTVGEISSTVMVWPQQKAPPAPSATAVRIKVGGNIQAARLIRQPRPAYPPELQQAGVEGTVEIQAIISKQGTVLNPKVVNTVDSRLAQAALDAVAQWQYQPTLLNGEPIEVLTRIDISFQGQ